MRVHKPGPRVLRILSVRVVVADFSAYIEDALAMFWDEACCGTEAAAARIDVVRAPGEWLCLACSNRFAPARAECVCTECGSEWVRPVVGDECYVDSIEVETGGG